MIPFLHLGPLTIPTFGLMVATGLLTAAYLLQADFDRRREQFLKNGYMSGGKPSHHDEGLLIIGMAGATRPAGAPPFSRLGSPLPVVGLTAFFITQVRFAPVPPLPSPFLSP